MHRRSKRHLPATSLIEVLIGLAIAVMLLTAIAATLMVALKSFNKNEQYIRERQASTIAMNYLTSKVRRCKELQFENPVTGMANTFTKMIVHDSRTDTNGIPNYTDYLCFEHDTTNNTMIVTKQGSPDTVITGLRNVKELTFHAIPEGTVASPIYRYVTIELTLDIPDNRGVNFTPVTLKSTVEARSIPAE